MLLLSTKLLLFVYSIVPFSALFVLLDVLVFDYEYLNYLPSSPEQLPMVLIVLVLPHIVASSISFLDEEYISYYWNDLFIPIAAIIIGVLCPPVLIGQVALDSMFAIWTVYHVMSQQFGISLMVIRWRGMLFDAWRWCGIALAGCIYLGVYFPWLFGENTKFVTLCGCSILLILFSGASIRLLGKCKDSLGRMGVYCNFALLLCATAFYSLGYSFFVILMPRLVHDIQAFMFYSCHDHNRNADTIHNYLFHLLRRVPLPIALLSPIVAIILAYPITLYSQSPWGRELSIMLTFFHYYIDSLVWKQGSLHRKFIKVV